MNNNTTKLASQEVLHLDVEKIRKAYFALRAINHKTRQKILFLLHKKSQMTVSEIYSTLKLEQSQTSTYLAILRKANIVIARRDGQSVYYSINYKAVSLVDKGVTIMGQD